MAQASPGSIRLFNAFGINVFLHWSWFLVAAYQIQTGSRRYSSIIWNVLEYLALFLIVLLHEFGHALACRQVGGQANRIVLWPLGGIAYVSPPPRPGAMLWSISAGPLVNVVLFPVLGVLMIAGQAMGLDASIPNVYVFFRTLLIINLLILVFNLLPVYPLDGGQILRSLLWFVFGRANSLMIAAVVGFIGVAFLLLIALWVQDVWIAIIAVFVLINCWSALAHARSWTRMAKAPRREGFACPNCKMLPPRGPYWVCSRCRNPFDTFETYATCPRCQTAFATTTCPECSLASPVSSWGEGA